MCLRNLFFSSYKTLFILLHSLIVFRVRQALFSHEAEERNVSCPHYQINYKMRICLDETRNFLKDTITPGPVPQAVINLKVAEWEAAVFRTSD